MENRIFERFDCKYENIYNSPLPNNLHKLCQMYWNDLGKLIELEVRLGIMKENSFVSGVGHTFFNGVKNYLLSKNIWNDKELKLIKPKEIVTYDIIYQDRTRVTLIYDDGNIKPGEIINKQKIDHLDFRFEKVPYAVRISTATEKPRTQAEKIEFYNKADRFFHSKMSAGDEQPLNVRKKIRISFNHKNEYEIDLTKTYDGKTIKEVDDNPNVIYEIEYEFSSPSSPIIQYLIKHIYNIGKYLLCFKDELLKPLPNTIFNETENKDISLNKDLLVEDEFPKYQDPLWEIIRKNNGKIPSEITKQINWVEAFPPIVNKLNGESAILNSTNNSKFVLITCHPCLVNYKKGRIPICAGHVIGIIEREEWFKYHCGNIPQGIKRSRPA